jgi:hypothetical protein
VSAIGRSISSPMGSMLPARAALIGAGKSISVPEGPESGAGRSVPPGESRGAGKSMSANGSKPEDSDATFGAGRSATPGSSNGSKSSERLAFAGAGRSTRSPPAKGAGRSRPASAFGVGASPPLALIRLRPLQSSRRDGLESFHCTLDIASAARPRANGPRPRRKTHYMTGN